MRYLLYLTILLFGFTFSAIAEEPEALKLKPEVWKVQKEGMVFDPAKGLPENEVMEPNQDQTNLQLDWLSPLLYAIIIIAVIFVLVVIIKNTKAPSNVKGNRVEATSIEDAEENLPDVTLNKIYQEAIDMGDFKSALRIKFLMLLQNMIDAGMIVWKKRKTNEQYLSELGKNEHKNHFYRIVNLYDKAWYGSFSITESQYQNVAEHIDSLNLLLNGEK